MKYKILGISTLFLSSPLLALSSTGEGSTVALSTYSSSEVSTGGLRAEAGSSASSESGSASVEIWSFLEGKNGEGSVQIDIKTEKNGTVQTKSIKKTTPFYDEAIEISATTTSDDSSKAAARVVFSSSSSTDSNIKATSSVFIIDRIFQRATETWFKKEKTDQSEPFINRVLEKLFSMLWFF
jgi:hypothetical protein